MINKISFFSFLNEKEFFEIKNKILNSNKNFVESKDNFEYLICIGGDGTMLNAMKLYYKQQIKIIGINFGHLGFLTNEIKDWNIDLNLNFETYNLLNLKMDNNDIFAINELLLYSENNPITIECSINDVYFYDYFGSGCFVSTKLGSTGLNRSMNNPILLNNNTYLFNEYNPVKSLNNKYLNQAIILDKNQTITLNLKNEFKQFLFVKNDGITNKINSKTFKIKLINSNAKIASLSLNNQLEKISKKLIG
ncbi:MAG: NAD(+)/NADH kinase [Ureaplasma sp.]|nr:NAD(+)/NADH kinase [Ureaplasma sp.]